MAKENITKTKKNKPVSIIVHAANIVSYNLAKTLAEQGSRVILVDYFDSKSKKTLLEIKKIGDIDFVDTHGLEDLMKKIGKVDYLFYIQSHYLLNNEIFESKDFLEESNNLNLCLKVCQKYGAKFSLVTTITFNEKLMYAMQNPNYSKPSAYSAEELQKYSETLVAEYHDKSKINARILRLGTILGEENDIDRYPIINKLFEDSVRRNSIQIPGEGLDINYLVNINDAVYGILKLTFSPKTNGEVISLCNNNDYTILSIAYKLLELNPNAVEIKFVPETEKKPLLYTQYIPAPNAEEYGWGQKISFEESISDTLKAKYNEYNKTWDKKEDSESEYKRKLEEIRKKREDYTPQEEVSKTEKTPLGEFISKLFSPISTKKKKQAQDDEMKKKKPTPREIIIKISAIILIVLLFYFLIYPLVSISIGSYTTYSQAQDLMNNYSDLEQEEVDSKLKSINNNVKGISNSFENLGWLFWVIQQDEMRANTSLLLTSLEIGSEGLIDFNENASPLITYLEEFEPAVDFQDSSTGAAREYTELLSQIDSEAPKIQESIKKIERASNILKEVDPTVYPDFLQQPLSQLQKHNLVINEQIVPFRQVISFLPDILGVDERQRYLVLLQNPAELRSTGGWISSYALVDIEGGQIRRLEVDDVYNLDGELKNQDKVFEPPEDMQEALDVNEWSLSLANWEPDFRETSQQAEFFIQEAGKASSVDGVITIDIKALQSLLERWGGISIPGEQEIITHENIYNRIFDMHQDFTPGQSQKATFLANLANETLNRLLSSDIQEYSEIMDVIFESLESKNILIFLKQTDAQKYFYEQNWDGSVSPTKYGNLPFAVEWNWAANKSNLYLNRQENIILEILDKDEIKYNYSLIIQNNSSTDTYPQGEYTNYTRVYLPENAEITSTSGFEDDEYNIYHKGGFKVIAGWFNIPTQSTRELGVQYRIENTKNILQTSNSQIYANLNIFKQPGTPTNDQMRIEIFYPETWSIQDSDKFQQSGIRLMKELILDVERQYQIEWQK